MSARTWGFKSPLRHDLTGVKLLVRGGAGLPLNDPEGPLVINLSSVARVNWCRSLRMRAVFPSRQPRNFFGPKSISATTAWRSSPGTTRRRDGRPGARPPCRRWREAGLGTVSAHASKARTQPYPPRGRSRHSVAAPTFPHGNEKRRRVGGHLKLPAGGQWVPNDGHYGVWSARREVFDDVAPGPGVRGHATGTRSSVISKPSS